MHRGVPPIEFVLGRIGELVASASRYDYLLGLIPVSSVLPAILGTTLRVSQPAVAAAAATFSGLAIVDALFRNPPRESSAGLRQA